MYQWRNNIPTAAVNIVAKLKLQRADSVYFDEDDVDTTLQYGKKMCDQCGRHTSVSELRSNDGILVCDYCGNGVGMRNTLVGRAEFNYDADEDMSNFEFNQRRGADVDDENNEQLRLQGLVDRAIRRR